MITNGLLPVPSVKGGAVELLTDILISENENKKDFEYVVFSVYDELAIEKSKQYKYTKFEWIRTDNIIYSISKVYRYLINRYTTFSLESAYIHQVINKLENVNFLFDTIIVQNKPEFGPFLRKVFPDKKIILHLHNDFLNKNTKKSFDIKASYDRIFCISKWLQSRVDQINNDSNTELLYNGIDVRKFYNVDPKIIRETRQMYNIEENMFTVLYTGRIVEEKGVLELSKAIHKARKYNNNIKLIITAEDKDSQRISPYLKKIHDILDEDDVIYTGKLDYEEVVKLTAAVKLGVVPSMWEEPLALTSIEHMACSHPVIITKSGGLIETVDSKSAIILDKENKNQFIDELSENILILSKDEMKLTEMGRNAKSRSAFFDKKNYVNRFVSLVKE